MGYYLLKLVITSVLIVAISEIGKKSSLVGAILASSPWYPCSPWFGFTSIPRMLRR
jgi:putative Ca2+/H+ antiporter (TMEM165/GDT1 family)